MHLPARIRLLVALALLVFQSVPTLALAESPNPSAKERPSVVTDPKAVGHPSEAPPVGSGLGDWLPPGPSPEPEKPKSGPTYIDQSRQSTRCYVGGRYVAAPPLCPN